MHHTPYDVSDVMTRTVVAVKRGARFKEIVSTMAQWKVSAVPVLEDEGRVIGVVSEADLLPKEEFRDSSPSRFEQRRRLEDLAKAGAVTAEELMSTPPVTVRPDTPLPQAARTMAVHRLKRLPVTDEEGGLQGIVSRSDLLKVFLRPDEDIEAEIRRDVIDDLFPVLHGEVRVRVADGVAILTGTVRDSSLVPVAARLVRAIEGVVDVECRLTGPAAPRADAPRSGPRA